MSNWDVIVIGGGAAGLFASASAAKQGARTLLLEKNNKIGVKILMSGGTRCNITHDCNARSIADAFGKKQGRFLYPALGKLPPEEVIRIVESYGVPTKAESTGKIFPVSDRSVDVRDALMEFARDKGATLKTNSAVEQINWVDSNFHVSTKNDVHTSPAIVITTGGKSYPGCGTTGEGYAWAERFQHSIVSPVPALTPLRTTQSWVKEMKGITIEDVNVSVVEIDDQTNKRHALATSRGSFLFTHFGFSGPSTLNVSRSVAAHPRGNTLKLLCDFSPSLNFELMLQSLRTQFQQHPRQTISVTLSDMLPRRLISEILNSIDVDPSIRCGDVSKKLLHAIVTSLKFQRFPISGILGFRKAEVTAGGVCLREINNRTMESKVQPGLYFAGEVLDVDGPIGGYNFQAAFSTGWLAGESAAVSRNVGQT